jgi:hypothetical protein
MTICSKLSSMNLMELVSNDNVHLAQESHTKETCHNSMSTIHISQVTHLEFQGYALNQVKHPVRSDCFTPASPMSVKHSLHSHATLATSPGRGWPWGISSVAKHKENSWDNVLNKKPRTESKTPRASAKADLA